MHLIDGKHLTIALLNLLQFPQKIPKQKQTHKSRQHYYQQPPEKNTKSNKTILKPKDLTKTIHTKISNK